MKFQVYVGISENRWAWRDYPFFQWLRLREWHISRIIIFEKEPKYIQ